MPTKIVVKSNKPRFKQTRWGEPSVPAQVSRNLAAHRGGRPSRWSAEERAPGHAFPLGFEMRMVGRRARRIGKRNAQEANLAELLEEEQKLPALEPDLSTWSRSTGTVKVERQPSHDKPFKALDEQDWVPSKRHRTRSGFAPKPRITSQQLKSVQWDVRQRRKKMDGPPEMIDVPESESIEEEKMPPLEQPGFSEGYTYRRAGDVSFRSPWRNNPRRQAHAPYHTISNPMAPSGGAIDFNTTPDVKPDVKADVKLDVKPDVKPTREPTARRTGTSSSTQTDEPPMPPLTRDMGSDAYAPETYSFATQTDEPEPPPLQRDAWTQVAPRQQTFETQTESVEFAADRATPIPDQRVKVERNVTESGVQTSDEPHQRDNDGVGVDETRMRPVLPGDGGALRPNIRNQLGPVMFVQAPSELSATQTTTSQIEGQIIPGGGGGGGLEPSTAVTPESAYSSNVINRRYNNQTSIANYFRSSTGPIPRSVNTSKSGDAGIQSVAVPGGARLGQRKSAWLSYNADDGSTGVLDVADGTSLVFEKAPDFGQHGPLMLHARDGPRHATAELTSQDFNAAQLGIPVVLKKEWVLRGTTRGVVASFVGSDAAAIAYSLASKQYL